MSLTPETPVILAPPPETRPTKVRMKPGASLFEPAIVRRAVRDAFLKLDPRQQVRNPVMFVVLVGSVWTTILFFRDLPHASTSNSVFVGLVSVWLWFTVLFANFAEAVAEGRGKAQADTLRKTRSETVAFVQQDDGSTKEVASTELKVGDLVVVTPGQLIPGDGDVIEGIASVDESAITGADSPVMADSSTLAMPSITSPSAGIRSFASQTTKSPFCN